MTEQASEYVTAGEIARRLAVSIGTVRSWAERGVIPSPSRVNPGNRRIWRSEDVSDLEARVEERRARRAPKAAGAA